MALKKKKVTEKEQMDQQDMSFRFSLFKKEECLLKSTIDKNE